MVILLSFFMHTIHNQVRKEELISTQKLYNLGVKVKSIWKMLSEI